MNLNILLYFGVILLIERAVVPSGYGNLIQYCKHGYWGDGRSTALNLFLGVSLVWSWVFFKFIFGV